MMASATFQQIQSKMETDLETMSAYVASVKDFGERQASYCSICLFDSKSLTKRFSIWLHHDVEPMLLEAFAGCTGHPLSPEPL